mmetsp:Transcript_3142/g.5255  ORF Transcript_3142/g.5255 Transcript_3142/m.5255 type:complete len:98 (+) Transcript_3142:52-345(+)
MVLFGLFGKGDVDSTKFEAEGVVCKRVKVPRVEIEKLNIKAGGNYKIDAQSGTEYVIQNLCSEPGGTINLGLMDLDQYYTPVVMPVTLVELNHNLLM